MDTYQLLPEDQITKLTLPTREGSSELGVELASAHPVGCALPYLEVDEELACGGLTLLENLLAVDADVCVLEAAVSATNLLEPRDAGLE